MQPGGDREDGADGRLEQDSRGHQSAHWVQEEKEEDDGGRESEEREAEKPVEEIEIKTEDLQYFRQQNLLWPGPRHREDTQVEKKSW